MTVAELLLTDYDILIGNLRKTLERVPADRADWSLHPKSMKLGKLAMHSATLPLFGYYILEDEGMNLADPNAKRKHADLTYTTPEALMARLEDSAGKMRSALQTASDAHMEAMWKFSFGEQLISHASRFKTVRLMCTDHMIHHTAQLGVYLRLLDIAVPGLYGPSADEPFGTK